MEKSFSLKKKKNVPTTQKEVFKDLGLDNHPLGRESPESGSLYSDYESGQQYEDKVGYFSWNKPKWLKSRETVHKSEGRIGMMADRIDGW